MDSNCALRVNGCYCMSHRLPAVLGTQVTWQSDPRKRAGLGESLNSHVSPPMKKKGTHLKCDSRLGIPHGSKTQGSMFSNVLRLNHVL